MSDTAPHAAWKPHKVIGVSEPSMAFIGRAVAMNIGGIECVLTARSVDDLAAAFGSISNTPLDESKIYKSTMMNSTYILIERPVETIEQPAPTPAPPPDEVHDPDLDGPEPEDKSSDAPQADISDVVDYVSTPPTAAPEDDDDL